MSLESIPWKLNKEQQSWTGSQSIIQHHAQKTPRGNLRPNSQAVFAEYCCAYRTLTDIIMPENNNSHYITCSLFSIIACTQTHLFDHTRTTVLADFAQRHRKQLNVHGDGKPLHGEQLGSTALSTQPPDHLHLIKEHTQAFSDRFCNSR